MRVVCEKCGAVVNTNRETVVQETRPPDRVGPAVHVIMGNRWVLHHCTPALDASAARTAEAR
jgi:hypothetical protein